MVYGTSNGPQNDICNHLSPVAGFGPNCTGFRLEGFRAEDSGVQLLGILGLGFRV